MNTDIYIFGKFEHGFTASIDDYTKLILKEYISKADAPTQIITHREGEIMNYGYVRKIEKDHLFGILVQINGQHFSTTKKLFEVFENIIANIAFQGDILSLNRNGNLKSVVTNFLGKPEGVEKAISICHNEIAILSSTCKDLPDIDYSTTDLDINRFNENDDNNTIIDTSVKNGYTFIYKEQDYDTLALGNYRSILSNLNEENDTNKKQIKELEAKLKNLEKKKKQMGLVFVLFAILLIGMIIFLNTIEKKNNDIKIGQTTIDKQKVENNILTEENKEIHKERINLQSRNKDLIVKLEYTSELLESLKLEYEEFRKENIILKKENATLTQQCNNYKSEVNSLKNQNSNLDKKLKKTETDLANKNMAYKNLQNDYNKINSQLNVMTRKYYSTKEGKKELKK